MKRKIAAILAADVAGYSRLVAEAEEDTLARLARAREIFDRVIGQGGGRIFNTAGDSVMCEFDSAVEALRVAVVVQAEVATLNVPVEPGRRLEFRMGLTIGDVVERDGDLLGDGVNVAARLESFAPPGGICVSRSVRDAVGRVVDLPFRDMGEQSIKNMPPVHVYVVAPAERAASTTSGPSQALLRAAKSPAETGPRRFGGKRIAIGVVALALAGAGLNGLRGLIESDPPPAPVSADVDETRSPVPLPPPRTLATTPAAPGERPARPDPSAESRPPADLYREARAAEARGDRPTALALYGALVARSPGFIDVNLRFATLLRAADGPGAARRVFGDVAGGAQVDALAAALAATTEIQNRARELDGVAALYPDYAPVQFLLGEELLSARGDGPTVTERRLAFEAFERFLEGDGTGRLAEPFLNRQTLTEWITTARRRRSEIEAAFGSAATRPTASFSRANAGWAAALTLPEPARSVSVRVGERGEFTSTGTTQALDPRTGLPSPNLLVDLPANSGRTTLYVRYTDRAGREAGPFPIGFDPGAARVSAARDALERFPDSWLSFRPDLPNVVSFAGLISNRCAIAKAVIGFGAEPPSSTLPLPPCDERGPSALPSDARSVMTVPADAEAVTVQLTYLDGTESQLRTFRRP